VSDYFKPEKQPQKQTEVDRSGGNSPPKTAVGTSGAGDFPPGRTAVGAAEDGSPDYRVGEELECLVLSIREGGYEILIVKDGIEGYLKSSEDHAIGAVFTAQFLRWQDRTR
jgi:hypothetical protein